MKLLSFFSGVAALLVLDASATVVENKRRLDQHVEHFEHVSPSLRSRRTADSNVDLTLLYTAFDEVFHLQLRQKDHNYKVNVVDSERTRRDVSSAVAPEIYEGIVDGQPNSEVNGFVNSNNVFVGTIRTEDGHVYYLEPSVKFNQHTTGHSSVIYRQEDVVYNGKTFIDAESDAINKAKKAVARRLSEKKRSLVDDDEAENIGRERRGPPTAIANTCYVHAVADHTYYDKTQSNADTLADLVYFIDETDRIFQDIVRFNFYEDFDVRLKGAEFTIYTSADAAGNPVSTTSTSSSDVLVDFSSKDFGDFCLGHLFSNRDYNDGVLGLAYVGSVNGNDGVCGRRQGSSNGDISLNTGISTAQNFGKEISRAVLKLVTAHEIGHNFGSPHDSTSDCLGNDDGNFLMYPQASSGKQANNDRYSSCSVASIKRVLDNRGSNCLQSFNDTVCGNGLKEEGEDCDCGANCDSDPCCNDQCTFVGSATCSAGDEECCDPGTCQPRTDSFPCRTSADDRSCSLSATCDGVNAACPLIAKDDTNTCGNDAYLCGVDDAGTPTGECDQSNDNTVCELYNLTFCAGEDSTGIDISKNSVDCIVFCRLPDNRCVSTVSLAGQELNGRPVVAAFYPVDETCENFEGYCSGDGKCNRVDFDILNELGDRLHELLSSEHIDTALVFIGDYWYYFLIGFLVVVSIFCAIFLYKRHVNHQLEKDIQKEKEDIMKRREHRAQPSEQSKEALLTTV